MQEDNTPKDDFFKVIGDIFISLDPPPFELLSANNADTIDAIQAQIIHLEKLIQTENPENAQFFNITVKLINDLYKAVKTSMEHSRSKLLTQFSAKKYTTTISANTISFEYATEFPTNEILNLTLVMTEYPYEYININAKVEKCEPLAENNGATYQISLSFHEITLENEDKIVKFVNSLQRKKILEQRTAAS